MPEDGVDGPVAKEREPQPVETSPDGRYTRFDVVLGRGAFKTVYKAFDEREGIEVAWNQVIRSEPVSTKEEYDTLLHEINVLKKLKHKNIMTFYDSWVDKKKVAVNFITELFTSGTLRQYRQKHKKISESVLKRWAWQVLQGLVYLHGHDPPIIHRDLKCDNIFVNGSSGVVKIGDLGLATLVRYTTQPQSVLGTPEFMAPELYDEKYDEKVDVYSFGMCMLELSTLQYPYSECANPAQIWKRVSKGIYPEGLKKVQDEDLRLFIQLCITHSSEARPEARKLLKHSFFESFRAEKEGESGLSGLQPRESDIRSLEPPSAPSSSSGSSGESHDHHSHSLPTTSSIASDVSGTSSVESRTEPLSHPVSVPGGANSHAGGPTDGSRSAGGAPVEDRAVSMPRLVSDNVGVVFKELDSDQGVALFELSILQQDSNNLSNVVRYEFDYNLDVDDTQTIMKEMQSDLHLSSQAAAHVAEHISRELERVKSRPEFSQYGGLPGGSSSLDDGHQSKPGAAATSAPGPPSLAGPSYRSILLRDEHHSSPDAPQDGSTDSSQGFSAALAMFGEERGQGQGQAQQPLVAPRPEPPSTGKPTLPEGLPPSPSPAIPPRPRSAAALSPSQSLTAYNPPMPPHDLSAGSSHESRAPVITPPAASAFESAHGTLFSSPGQALSLSSIPTTASSGPTAGGLSHESSRHSSATLQGNYALPPPAPVHREAAPLREARPSAGPPPALFAGNGAAALPTPPIPRPAPASSSPDMFADAQAAVPRQPSVPPRPASASLGGDPPVAPVALARQPSRDGDNDGNRAVNRNLSLSDVRRRFQQYEEDTFAKNAS